MVYVIVLGGFFMILGLAGMIRVSMGENRVAVPLLQPPARIAALVIGLALMVFGMWRELGPIAPSLSPVSPSNPVVLGEFEVDTEKWGDFPKEGVLTVGKDVSQYCDPSSPISKNGKCSLKYQPAASESQDVFLARFASADDIRSLISTWVYVPEGVCSEQACSTARLIVWDANYESSEGLSVELNQPGEWLEITLDLRDKTLPEPYKALGVHYYLEVDYNGPLYMDALSVGR